MPLFFMREPQNLSEPNYRTREPDNFEALKMIDESILAHALKQEACQNLSAEPPILTQTMPRKIQSIHQIAKPATVLILNLGVRFQEGQISSGDALFVFFSLVSFISFQTGICKYKEPFPSRLLRRVMNESSYPPMIQITKLLQYYPLTYETIFYLYY